MVKFKSRYVLLEIIGVSNTGHHTSYRIKQEILADKILKDTEHLFGEVGVSNLKTNFQVKYVNEITNLVIIRVGRNYLKILQTVLFIINQIDGKDVRMRIIHISGTIKKIEEKAKIVLSYWVEKYEQEQLLEKYKLNNLCLK
jgi:ribonuclease P/MRP protein subunit POP5